MKIINLKDLAKEPTSHNIKIQKKVLLRNGEVKNMTNLSLADFPTGEIAPSHIHQDMSEIFYIEEGEVEIEIDGKTYQLSKGMCAVIEPGESHELRNTGKERLVVLCIGIQG